VSRDHLAVCLCCGHRDIIKDRQTISATILYIPGGMMVDLYKAVRKSTTVSDTRWSLSAGRRERQRIHVDRVERRHDATPSNVRSVCTGKSTSVSRVVVSVSTSRSQDGLVLGLVSRKIVNVSVSGGRRLGLGHLLSCPRPSCIAIWCQCINSFLLGMQTALYYMQCERVLDVVSLCCIAHHINMLKQ